ncbi:MAG: 5-formyltetrahydrofolate cyclo-ligase [Pyrinomonadaceae bacterium]
MTKNELRKIYLERKKDLSDEERTGKSLQIAEHFFRHCNLENVRFLHVFLSIGSAGEVDTAPIIERLWREFPQIRTVVPRIDRETGLLESVEYDADSNLLINYWGIREPAGNKVVENEEIDLVIVPLLCVDRRGHRVGYGKGFYDKFLAGCRADCLKTGVSFFPPIDEISDVHGGDVPLDFAITPEGVVKFSGAHP